MSAAQPTPAPVVTAPPAVAGPPAPSLTEMQVDTPTSSALTSSARTADTPSRLQALGLGVVVISLLVGLVGGLTFSYLAYALHRAEAATAELIRVQQIQTNLLTADATATNAFLVGGLEPPVQRAAYDEALSATGRLIAEAADAQPADASALAALNDQVVDYAASIEQARANNRQGFPVGSQYLRNASSSLRSQAMPILDNLVDANADRARGRMTAAPGWIFVVVGFLGLAGLAVGQVWLARRFHRRLNVGLLSASVVLLVALSGGTIAVVQLGSTVRSVASGSFAAVNAAADARIEASNAKSNESLTLIARGSGTSFETAWKASSEAVTSNLDALGQPAVAKAWTDYRGVHGQIRKLDDGGSWDAAVALATGTAPTSSNSTFNRFDTALRTQLEAVTAATTRSLAGTQPGLIIAAVLILLAGIAAALLGRRGVAARLREYR